ncbi:MAG: radical SAM protein [FCB group bacterium]|jgi:radical SAM superfamily enzyme YgiQ (UPF0313 family)|nr:radical SAM protein [FCB group bacterium]
MQTRFKVIYILPSRYDEEGYVMRYWRGILPSNTLSCLRGLTCALADSKALGPGVDLTVDVYDDTVQRIPLKKIARLHRRGDTKVVVGLVGVQSNQFARATDIALALREHGIPVMIGGFHVSGVLAMFHEPTPELECLLNRGVTLVRGEVDGPGVLEGILRDALDDRLQPLYEITEPPDLSNAPVPMADARYRKRFANNGSFTIDTSRGCPFNCSFCTVINVQGRTMRYRSVECVLKAVEDNHKNSRSFCFFTDDNMARNPLWEELFDALAAQRARGIDALFMMQVDTQAYKIPRFVEKASAAGCNFVFIGLETVNPDNLKSVGKAQNKVDNYAEMVDAWHRAGMVVHCGYIIGFPGDTPESIRRDVTILKDQVKVDEVTFFMLTPLPGSRDHFEMVRNRVPMDADLNSYDSFHETHRHARMRAGEWLASYREAWASFYNKENMVNVLLRTPRERYWQLLHIFVWYRTCVHIGTHPMVTGLARLKDRVTRRPAFARESIPRYARRRLCDMYGDVKIYLRVFLEFQEIWLLTRPQENPRLATLTELRARWTDLRRTLSELEVAGRCEEAVQEVQGLLRNASERLRELSAIPQATGWRARRKLRRMTQEVEAYLHTLEAGLPDWQRIRAAQRFIGERVVAGYEEMAFHYVAKRRRFDAYRHDFLQRLRQGRFLPRDLSFMPRALVFEVVCGLRFGWNYFSHF